MGDFEAVTLVAVESTLKYQPYCIADLTWARKPGRGHCVVGCLTGAVSSQKVTEEPKGTLSTVGNRA